MSKAIYGITRTGVLSGLVDRCSFLRLDLPEDHTRDYPVIVDDSTQRVTTTGPVFNTSNLVKVLLLDKEENTKFCEEHKLSKERSTSVVYMLINKDGEVSPPCEIAYSSRFMNGEVGSEIAFAHGCAIMPDAFEAEGMTQDILQSLKGNYAGELTIGVDSHRRRSAIGFGHQPCFFAMYAEFYHADVNAVMNWLMGKAKLPELHQEIVLANLVSKAPFPAPVRANKGRIRCNMAAEKHVWRIPVGDTEVALVSAASNTITEGRQRIYRTINYMRKYDDNIQYRTDAAYNLTFALSNDKYKSCQPK